MLVLTRRQGEAIVIGDHIRLTVLGVRGNKVRLGVRAPADTTIRRQKRCRPDDPPAEGEPRASGSPPSPGVIAARRLPPPDIPGNSL